MNTDDKGGFSGEEKAAMTARAAELKAEARRGRAADKAAADRASMVEKIAEMPEPDRALAERLHELVTEAAPALLPKPYYYGQPGRAKDRRIVVFFRSGLVDKALLDGRLQRRRATRRARRPLARIRYSTFFQQLSRLRSSHDGARLKATL